MSIKAIARYGTYDSYELMYNPSYLVWDNG
jgi:hypothetical protein